jgi:hypothetical protein
VDISALVAQTNTHEGDFDSAPGVVRLALLLLHTTKSRLPLERGKPRQASIFRRKIIEA